MAISNCLFSPTSENPHGFSAWCVLAKLTAKQRNYSYPRPLAFIANNTLQSKVIWQKICEESI
mgnify:CR=1 FL=1